jgi:hypothetical protein
LPKYLSIFRHPAFLFSNALAKKASKEVTPALEQNADGCSVKESPRFRRWRRHTGNPVSQKHHYERITNDVF